MHGPMRVIKFGQTHRRTGARRRFVIAQVADTTSAARQGSDVRTAERHSSAAMDAWRYKVQLGDDGVWSAFRPIEVTPDATEKQIRRAAVLHLAGRAMD